MNITTCTNGMVDTCCENYDNCALSYHDKDAEIKRLNEKTSDLIRKGIEEHKINAELRAEIERLKQRTWVGLTDEEYDEIWRMDLNNKDIMDMTISKLKDKNNG